MKLLTNDELAPMIATLEQREALLERWRCGEVDRTEQQAAWLCLSQIVQGIANRHYKCRQPTGRLRDTARQWYDVRGGSRRHQRERDKHQTRILQLGELLRSRKDKSIMWCVDAFKRRFQQFEMQAELTVQGFGAPKSEQSGIINDLIKVKRVMREHKRKPFNFYVNELRKRYPARFRGEKSARNAVVLYYNYLGWINRQSLEKGEISDE